MDSPIAFLDRNIFMTLRNVAPERKDELERLFNIHDIKLEMRTDDPRMMLSADLISKTIIARRPRLERIWALAFGYYRFYREVAAQKQRDLRVKEVDLTSTQKLVEAGRLIEWAVDSYFAAAREEDLPSWPNDLPRPSPQDDAQSDEAVATELFLVATGYLLHHELAHIRLGHRLYSEIDEHEAIRQEKEADDASANWMLDQLHDELDPLFQKRALGVGLGLVALASLYLQVYAGAKGGKTHPPAYDRLFQVMDRYVKDDGNLPWAFVLTVLSLHIQNRQIPHDTNQEFGSFREAADYYIDVISKIRTST